MRFSGMDPKLAKRLGRESSLEFLNTPVFLNWNSEQVPDKKSSTVFRGRSNGLKSYLNGNGKTQGEKS